MDFERTKFLEFDVPKGYVLYIPPYWWYSIQYSKTPGTFVCEVAYNTIMNCVSNIPDLCLYFLQQQNITKKIAKIPETVIPSPSIVLEIPETKSIQSDSNVEEVFPHPPIISDIQVETEKPVDLIVEISETNDLSRTIAAETIDNVIEKITTNKVKKEEENVVVQNI
jgi:hypothetical protein